MAYRLLVLFDSPVLRVFSTCTACIKKGFSFWLLQEGGVGVGVGVGVGGVGWMERVAEVNPFSFWLRSAVLSPNINSSLDLTMLTAFPFSQHH